MTDSPADPSDSDAEDETDGEETPEVPARKRGRGKLLDLEKQAALDEGKAYAVADLHDETVEVTFEADGVTKKGGRPAVIARLLEKFEKLYESLGGAAMLTHLEFGNSVTVTLRPDVSDQLREEARELSERAPDEELSEAAVRHFVPDSIVSAAIVVTLLETKVSDGLEVAEQYGSEVTAAYIQFAKELDARGATVKMTAPGGREGTLTKRRAAKIAERAKNEAPLKKLDFWIAGRLTRADSEDLTFRVVLDRAVEPARELDGRKKAVEGKYSKKALDQVQEDSLWGVDVRARVIAEPVMKPGRAKPVFEVFTFQEVVALEG